MVAMVTEEALAAARTGDLSKLRSLGDEKVATSRDKLGATCLHYAARGGCVETLDFLVNKKGLNATKRSNVGATSAHDAAAAGNLPALKWILNNTDCSFDDQDGNGATILHLSARYGHAQIVQWLIDETECDISVKTANYALPIHFAAEGGHVECVKMLVKAAPSCVNIQTNTGLTPVYLASQDGHLEILKFLVEKAGGSVLMKSFDGMSVLHAAAQNNHLHCVKWLIKDQQMNPNDRDFDGATPLHFAASRGHAPVVEWLLKHGGAIITLDNLGGSPLHNAAEMGQQECIQVLLENGCDPDIVDNNDFTAADLAEKCHQQQCAAIIKGEITFDRSKLSKSLQVNGVLEAVASSSSNYLSSQEVKTREETTDQSVSFESVLVGSGRHNSECSVYSQETGETECLVCLKSSQHSQHQLQDFAAAILHESHDSELSSDTSTLSSVSSPAVHEVDSNFRLISQCNDKRTLSEIQSQFEHLNSSVSHTSDIRRYITHVQVKDKEDNFRIKMSNDTESVQTEGAKKTVIQIKGNNIKINDSSGVREISTGSPKPDSPRVDNSNQEWTDNSEEKSTQDEADSGAVVLNSTVTVNTVSNGVSRIQVSSEKSESSSVNNEQTSPGSFPPKTCVKSSPVSPVYGQSRLASLLVSTAPKRVAASPSPPPKTPPETSVTCSPNTEKKDLNESVPSPNSSPEVRPQKLADNPFMNQNGHVPARYDIIAELKAGGGVGVLKKSRGPERQVTKEVFSFGGKNSQQNNTPPTDSKPAKTDGGQWDPKQFLDKVPEKDSSGHIIPDWRRQMLAKQAADKAKKEAEEQMRIELEEARFLNIPAWKRALIEKKEKQNSQSK